MQVEELNAVRQTLQADLETSIRRIVDLQAALEEVESSDESDIERYDGQKVLVKNMMKPHNIECLISYLLTETKNDSILCNTCAVLNLL